MITIFVGCRVPIVFSKKGGGVKTLLIMITKLSNELPMHYVYLRVCDTMVYIRFNREPKLGSHCTDSLLAIVN